MNSYDLQYRNLSLSLWLPYVLYTLCNTVGSQLHPAGDELNVRDISISTLKGSTNFCRRERAVRDASDVLARRRCQRYQLEA